MQWINDDILQAICRTFLHSLWQGMIAAILAGLVLLFTRRTAARTRYNLLGAILLLSLLAAGFTFYLESGVTPATQLAASEQYIIVATPSATPSIMHPGDILLQYMNAHAGLIMLLWLIVFMFKCCRLMNGFLHIRRIRQEALPVTAGWDELLVRLSQQLGISGTVRLLETTRAQVPFTLGFLKPCIYVPLGLLAQLPADQVETILLHELAHIRRRDYLVNILQNISDTVFFFNPALLWISALLREEREACCDDIVVAHTPHQHSYLHALVAFQERAVGMQPGMALLGKQHHLLDRVKRLLTRENKKLGIMEKSILMLGVLAFTAFSFMPVQDNHILDKASKESINPVWLSENLDRSLAEDITIQNSVCDTLPVKKTKKVRIDTVYLSPRKQENPNKPKEKVRVEYINLDKLNKDSAIHIRSEFIYQIDSVRLELRDYQTDSIQILRLDTTHIYKVDNNEATIVYTRPQVNTIIQYTPQALNVPATAKTVQVIQSKPMKLQAYAPKPLPATPKYKPVQTYTPKPLPATPKYKTAYTPKPLPAPKSQPAPVYTPKPLPAAPEKSAPAPRPQPEVKPKKPSKYEPVLPAALLKTMNIGKPETEC